MIQIRESLQKLIGLHRQLLEACRLEREALVQADLNGIEETTQEKQALVEAIRAAEVERLNHVATLAMAWKRPLRELSLSNLILAVQATAPKMSDQLRSNLNALTVLLDRIQEQNDDNRRLVERSLVHVNQMKKNVLGEAVPKSNTYTAHGQRQATTSGARLISKEV
ncbi:flagellar protein FlgN [Bdellovibrionota bacterium FG-1]